ncbi:BREX-2 system adenine-specific DNA-methyltransferase PglX [Microbispora sp. NBC_01389]|uniref:BREX-2 system adenine-specific DNA-methyltransferase PglX n=1 Tax=Microbispora sp. NBC_01389 TaxID=2903584 RepID=UPI003252A4A8
MIVSKALKDDLVKQVKSLEVDLREQAESVVDVRARLRAEYERAFKLGRTGATWASWRDERVTQAAAAWALGTVFVRFCEDNALLAQQYIAGSTHDALLFAEEAQEEFFRANPAETDRGWLLAAFAEIGRSQAGHLLFDVKHNPLYQIPLSHDAAKGLLAFWRRRGESGVLVHSFDSGDWDTRFLGDLYQDLSEAARKNFALLQTPEFVEEFILDYTLTPAIAEFGHDAVKVIDPTCGSGHFLLGAFHRLLDEWVRLAPARDQRELVRLALGAVHGVDLNPFAVAIARFRLLIAAMKAAGFTSLADLENHDLGNLNIAIGDALIKHPQRAITGIDDDQALADFHYATEDRDDFPGILDEGRYHVVVGNPPYITVKDKKLNQLYRDLYDACSGKYALSVPFAQRFYQLARTAGADGRGSGYVGQITANSFMKREFGKVLIESFFRDKIELTHVIDTSGAYIPGHGTPTVILVGRNKDYRYARGETIRTVMGIRGEPTAPEDPSKGLVWQAITNQIDRAGTESEWISVSDQKRDQLAGFPWSLAGGGAGDLQEAVEHDRRLLDAMADSIGITSFTLEDDLYLLPMRSASRLGIPIQFRRSMCVGDALRDWDCGDLDDAIFPYDEDFRPITVEGERNLFRYMWPGRTVISRNLLFGGKSKIEGGLRWSEYGRLTANKLRTPLSIAFAFVASHNHFVLDRGGKVFKQSAPVIKLPEGATEDEHLELLGVLNSSTACFWLKQVSQKKGGAGNSGGGRSDQPWSWSYEFTGTKLQEFPLPETLPLDRGRQLDALAQRLASVCPSTVAAQAVPTGDALARARDNWYTTLGRMFAAQEELDWEVYSLYGLLDDDLTAPADAVPDLNLGERAFEIVLARKMAAGEVETEWFSRHNSKPITELPDHWPAEYRAVVEKRIALIQSDRNIGLIERPECKRRWASEGFDAMQERALREWLLDRFEARELWFHHVDGMEQPRLLTTAQLADALRRDADVVSVAELYAGGKDLEKVVAELVADEHVPYLAALRYKDSGLRKRADWEDVWDRQRAEDAAESQEAKKKIRDAIPVPPKYGSGDFLKPSYWRNRGKLDLPKERFVSYPYAGRDGASSTKDGALLLGWAGFDHREQAQSLATLIVEREQSDGWGADRLAPLLAGLREVLPWVRQWHGEFDAAYGASPAEIYAGFLDQMASNLKLTDDDLAGWRPPAAGRGRRK